MAVCRYKKLRIRMMECDMDLHQLASVILRSRTTASARLNGHEPWNIEEIYAVCEKLDIPYAEIHVYFPPAAAKNNGKMKAG